METGYSAVGRSVNGNGLHRVILCLSIQKQDGRSGAKTN